MTATVSAVGAAVVFEWVRMDIPPSPWWVSFGCFGLLFGACYLVVDGIRG